VVSLHDAGRCGERRTGRGFVKSKPWFIRCWACCCGGQVHAATSHAVCCWQCCVKSSHLLLLF